ncbi:HNH endonuclease [Streptomyces sp. NPDC092296]|uniref:HNH endonuclease n=1 Tax=Streptomyces sp. NPDC092296 TaxID=3366012 RepID=UPI00380A8048
MARGHGRILTSIWSDDQFTALDRSQQWLYLLLMSQPNLSHGGLMPITTKRWAGKARGVDPGDIHWTLDALERHGFVTLDRGEEELYINGYFRHAGIGGQPRVVAAAHDAITRSASFVLRAVASIELSEAVAKAPAPAAPRGLRAAVLQRDGWQCKQCGWSPGDPVPPAPTGRPIYRGLELDHIHPKSLGGPDTFENFQVLCTTCNTRKGARV